MVDFKKINISKQGRDKARIWHSETLEEFFTSNKERYTLPITSSITLYDIINNPRKTKNWNTGGQLTPVLEWYYKNINNLQESKL